MEHRNELAESVWQFLTSCGRKSNKEAAYALQPEDDLESYVDAAIECGWVFPNTDGTRQEIREIFRDFYEVVTGQSWYEAQTPPEN